MNLNMSFKKINQVFIFVIVSGTLTLTGCGSSLIGGDFDANGLPNQKYFVGGGLEIDWIAPQAGTIYLVEETTGRIFQTKSLESGEEFSFRSGPADPEEIMMIFGTEMSKLHFSLYFIPVNKAVLP